MLKFIGRQWRGEAPFWVSVLLFSLLLPWALIIAGTQWLSKDTIEGSPLRSMATSAVIYSVIAMVGIWQIVGTWRAQLDSPGAGPLVDHAVDGAARCLSRARGYGVCGLHGAARHGALLFRNERHRHHRTGSA